jgi:radical SAM/Cys-rich protein
LLAEEWFQWELLLMATQSNTAQLPILNGHGLAEHDFDAALFAHGCGPLARDEVTTLQINVGKRCNQACHHCHVEAGPKRKEIMPVEVADRVLEVLGNSPAAQVVDITGGAPELNPNFRRLVIESRKMGRNVIDRCNLTVLFEPGMEDLAEFLAENEVEIIASLPCYTAANVDQQRGRGVFDKSIAALHLLNDLGYGKDGSPLQLNLVYNPLGASLPPPQNRLELDYKRELRAHFDIEFHHLLTLTNMPIRRFAAFLQQSGKESWYMSLLVNHFNPTTVSGLMCRSLLSVGWDGQLYDCDFNQMLDMAIGKKITGDSQNIWEIDSTSELAGCRILTGGHCFGCTAGAGSSCGGALA